MPGLGSEVSFSYANLIGTRHKGNILCREMTHYVRTPRKGVSCKQNCQKRSFCTHGHNESCPCKGNFQMFMKKHSCTKLTSIYFSKVRIFNDSGKPSRRKLQSVTQGGGFATGSNSRRRPCERRPFGVQKAAFDKAEGRLLQPGRRPFKTVSTARRPLFGQRFRIIRFFFVYSNDF